MVVEKEGWRNGKREGRVVLERGNAVKGMDGGMQVLEIRTR